MKHHSIVATGMLALSFTVMAAGCTSEARQNEPDRHPLERLPDDEAGRIIRNAIEIAGGDAWLDRRSVEHGRTTVQFDSEGNAIRTIVDRHQYVLDGRPKIRIEREADGEHLLLINNGEQAWKFVNGEPATDQPDRDHAWNATFGSHYVFWMPFKLTDPGTMMEYLGQRETESGAVWDEVVVTYEPGAGSAGGMHTWTYYFDAEDGTLAANHLHSGPEAFSFTEYHDYRRVDGILLPSYRVGYRSNAGKERLERISEIRYEDIRFNVPLPDSLFAPETALEN